MWPIVGPADRSLEVLGLGAFQGQALEHLSLSTLSVSVALQGIKWQGVDMWARCYVLRMFDVPLLLRGSLCLGRCHERHGIHEAKPVFQSTTAVGTCFRQCF